MSLAKLKFVAAMRRRKTVADIRRDKLLGKLDEQIGLASAVIDGGSFEAKRAKVVVDADGRRSRELVPASVKPWWWKTSDGKLLFTIQYGAKPLELAKGKAAIEVANMQELVEALKNVRAAADAGELDGHIETVSASLSAAFKRKTTKGGRAH